MYMVFISYLAEKVKEENFVSVKDSLFTMIKRICSNLPCPECAGHAQHKLASLNVKNIRSKRDLQLMLLSFHNEVNKRVGNPMFTEQQWMKNTRLLIQAILFNIFTDMAKPNANPKLLTVGLHKSQALKEFKIWWSTNHIRFGP